VQAVQPHGPVTPDKRVRTTTIGFIGAGRVGTALARALRDAGYPVVAVASRSFESARALAGQIDGCTPVEAAQSVTDTSDVTFITTPDDAIAAVAGAITWRPGTSAVHTSGAASLDVLAPARSLSAHTGSLHPLQTFAGRDEHTSPLTGSTFAIEGDEYLVPVLHEMVEALGGHPITLPPGAKALYHIAAVLVSNYTVTLADLAAGLWESFGVDRDTALRALLPLMQGTVRNLEALGLPDALTGPIARGDTGTVERHLDALAAAAPGLLDVYRALGVETIKVAEAKGTISESVAASLRGLLASKGAVGR
jgi:predicted short-subunit dehydrogenase-like oxidoreductase (DUF2520 family)